MLGHIIFKIYHIPVFMSYCTCIIMFVSWFLELLNFQNHVEEDQPV